MTQTAKNYGDALYELARDEGLAERLLTELCGVDALISDNPDYLRLLSSPTLTKAERCAALDEAFSGRVHSYVLSLLKLLCERGHIRELKGCCTQYRRRRNEDAGIVEATAVTAVPLTPSMRQRIADKLRAVTGKQIDLQLRVDPTVLGGVRLELEGRQFDGTVRQRLDGLRKTLSDTVI